MSTISFKKLAAPSLLFFLLALTKAVPAEEIVAIDPAFAASDDTVPQEMAPPAPPGPYKSTGLRDISVEKPPVVMPPPASNVPAKSARPPVVRKDSNEMPMEASSPDIPWPEDIRPLNPPSPVRSAPNYRAPAPYGNKQVRPDIAQKLYGTQRNCPSLDKSCRYIVNPNTNVPYMNGQRSPGINHMGVGSYRPYAGPSGYGYQAPNRFIPQNSNPSGYPVNRMPSPSSYQQSYPN